MNPFDYIFQPANSPASRHLLLLHGTGGDENDMLPIGQHLLPGAAILSPRGKISENGAPRFFRRFGPGQLDVNDWKFRSGELADFLDQQDEKRELDPALRVAAGYSNGANIAQGLLLLRPESIGAAVLFRPMFVTDDVPNTDLEGRRVLVLSGTADPLRHPADPDRLVRLLLDRGARVDSHLLPAGHELTPADIDIAHDWIASLT
ncbi:MAG: alpha/beta hydrolase [Terrimicrobiaceae bacterium]|nr:alpha/beta hydrolase [Terrimicrobiaceae bacterium]